MSKVVSRVLLGMVLLCLASVGFVISQASGSTPPLAAPNGATVEVHVKQASLSQSCDGTINGAHFVINQITAPPASITVWLSDGSVHDVALTKTTSTTAHYTFLFDAGLTVVDATAVVPSDWTGQFVLSNYLCGTSTPSPSPTPTPAPSS